MADNNKKVIRDTEYGEEYSINELLAEFKERKAAGEFDEDMGFDDWLEEITGKNGTCEWIKPTKKVKATAENYKDIPCIEDDETGEQFTLNEMEAGFKKRQEDGSIDPAWTFKDYLMDITGKNGSYHWIDE